MKSLDAWTGPGGLMGRLMHPLEAFWRRHVPAKPLWVFLFALLFGRALILNELSPFGLAFFAVSLYLWPEWAHLAFFGQLLGAALSPLPHAPSAAVSAALFGFLSHVARRFRWNVAVVYPLIAALSQGLSALVWRRLFMPLSPYAWSMSAAEALLTMVLFIIFLQSIPVLLNRRLWSGLRQEELIAAIIVVATLLSGTIGWRVGDVGVHAVLARGVVFLLAYAGGGAFGATAGVLSGLLLGLSDAGELKEMSALGIAGLLAGLFRPAGRFGAAFGGLVGIALIAVYSGGVSGLGRELLETLLAGALMLVIPEGWVEELKKMVPGTRAYWQDQETKWRETREALNEKFNHFAAMFQTLADQFVQAPPEGMTREPKKALLLQAAATACGPCWKKDHCWSRLGEQTSAAFLDMIERLKDGPLKDFELPHRWKQECVSPERVVHALERLDLRRRKEAEMADRLKGARRLVVDQLLGLSKVMREMAEEIGRDGPLFRHREANLLRAVEHAGFLVQSFKAVRLVPGDVAIELELVTGDDFAAVRELERLLSRLLDEVMVTERVDSVPGGRFVRLASGTRYRVHFGFAQAAKGGGLVSGDSALGMTVGRRTFALVLSDGMGSGENARRESQTAVEMLRAILSAGFDETLAVRALNALLALRGLDERFATVDLALIDLNDGRAKFLKVGAAPSYIRRGEVVLRIEAQNPPAGILEEIDVDVVETEIRPGDVVVFMSDGVYEAERRPENRELWLRRLIRETEASDPQAFADVFLDAVVHETGYALEDDMTVAVMMIEEVRPAWATVDVRSARTA